MGQTRRKVGYRWKEHVTTAGKNTPLSQAIAEHGSDAFEVTTLTTVPRHLLHNWELHYILTFESNNPEKGYNTTCGNVKAALFGIPAPPQEKAS